MSEKKETVQVMNKPEFVKVFKSHAEAEGVTLTLAEAELMSKIMGETIKDVVSDGYGAKLEYFVIKPVYRNARKGRNPKTGEELDIDASVGVSAKLTKAGREALNA